MRVYSNSSCVLQYYTCQARVLPTNYTRVPRKLQVQNTQMHVVKIYAIECIMHVNYIQPFNCNPLSACNTYMLISLCYILNNVHVHTKIT